MLPATLRKKVYPLLFSIPFLLSFRDAPSKRTLLELLNAKE